MLGGKLSQNACSLYARTRHLFGKFRRDRAHGLTAGRSTGDRIHGQSNGNYSKLAHYMLVHLLDRMVQKESSKLTKSCAMHIRLRD